MVIHPKSITIIKNAFVLIVYYVVFVSSHQM